jgi:VWFA-related protein
MSFPVSGGLSLHQCRRPTLTLCTIAILLGLFALRGYAQSTTTPATSSQPASPPPNATPEAPPQAKDQPAPSEDKNAAELTTTHQEDTTFKVNVNLVVVRVVVRDAQGHAVGTLKKEDFQLFDNARPQAISRFAVEQPGILSARPTGSNETPAKSPAAPSRYVAYLFDDIHLQAGDIIQVRNAAITHLDALLPTDRAAVYTTSGQVMLDFTDDRARLRDTLMRIKPSPQGNSRSLTNCPDISFYAADRIINKHDSQALRVATQDAVDCAHLLAGDTPAAAAAAAQTGQRMAESAAEQELTRGTEETRLALGTLRDVTRRISEMPGQRTIVLVSPGFILADEIQRETDVIDRALHSSVIISSLGARGLDAAGATGDITKSRTPIGMTSVSVNQLAAQSAIEEADVLSELAYGTGGTFFHNNNDLSEGFRRVATAPEYYYVLGFAPQNMKTDGKYHTLKVTLTQKQPLSLQARKGYYAPKHVEDASELAKQELNDAVFSWEERHDLPVEVHTKFFKSSDEDAKLAVLAHVDVRHVHFRKIDGRNRNDLTVVSALFDRNGNFVKGDQKTLQMRLTDQTLETKLASGVTLKADFDVKSGSYLVRLVVRDDEGQISAVNDTVEIP